MYVKQVCNFIPFMGLAEKSAKLEEIGKKLNWKKLNCDYLKSTWEPELQEKRGEKFDKKRIIHREI